MYMRIMEGYKSSLFVDASEQFLSSLFSLGSISRLVKHIVMIFLNIVLGKIKKTISVEKNPENTQMSVKIFIT